MILERFWSKVDANGPFGCWEWTASKRTSGYGQLKIQDHLVAAHRFSYELHRGRIPVGMHCLHSCDNRACVNPTHLFLGSNSDNVSDMMSKERQARGDNSGRAKLSERDVIAIRQASDPTCNLVEKYGIGPKQIWRIRSGNSWSHVKEAS